MPLYLGDAIDFLFGKNESDSKSEFKKTTGSIKALGWEFEKFDETNREIHFKKGEWKLSLRA
ncbi:MAG: hypothetical protein ABIF01_00455 [Candidatus Micrarchaeota archaeon]